jgi:inosine/xanthosine triphosphatase
VPSGVADQPLSDEETLKGAMNRVENAYTSYPVADFWIGIEGGVKIIENELAAFAWVVVKSKDLTGKARSATFFLPPAVKELIEKGMELGTADDIVFGHTNSKQQGGAVGLLTANVIDRKQLYEQAVVLTLIPFKNKDLYDKE